MVLPVLRRSAFLGIFKNVWELHERCELDEIFMYFSFSLYFAPSGIYNPHENLRGSFFAKVVRG